MRVPVLLSRFIALTALIAAAPCTLPPPISDKPSPPPLFLAGFALPNVVYYGNCGIVWPTVLTFRSDFTSDYSLRVTARYDYVSENPRLPESTTLSVQLAQLTTVTYGGSIDSIPKPSHTYAAAAVRCVIESPRSTRWRRQAKASRGVSESSTAASKRRALV